MTSKAITYTVKVDKAGNRRWFNAAGKRHRKDGPAIEYADGRKEWWINDNLHREDGPAVEWKDGVKYWFINDHKLTEQEFNARNAPCNGKI